MQIYTCVCGGLVSFGSMPPPSCERCAKCGSRPVCYETESKPTPHRFATRYNELTGEPYLLCETCFRTKDDLEKHDQLDKEETP